jgi:O-antigen/teichoic acid export membrane protein
VLGAAGALMAKVRMFRSVLLILSGNVSNALITLVRTLVIARLISVEDFGIASTFLLAMAIVEMTSALGLQQQLVQARNGNDPYLQAALQGFQALRGLTNGLILFLLAPLIARFFETPEVTWAYQMVALVPVMRGFMHFDVHRFSRQMNYVPSLMTQTLPPLGSLLLVWPLSLLFLDYRITLYAVLAQNFILLVASHAVARRPYRVTLDRQVMAGSVSFGWPLLLNGMLMFAIFNVERMIVGRELGMVQLGLFSMAFSLALSPTLVMAKSGMSFFLPQLSAAQHDPPAFRNLAMCAFQAHLVLGNTLVLAMALLGGPFLHLALGEKYGPAIPLLTWLAIMQGVRVIKGGSSTVAMARAHTGNAMVANVLRVALLPLAWWVAANGGDLLSVIWIGIAGEVAGFVIALWLALWRLDLPKRPLVLPFAISFGLFIVAGIHALTQYDAAHWMPDPWTGSALVLLFGMALWSMRDLRRYVAARRLTRPVE